MAGPDKIQQKPKKAATSMAVWLLANYYTVVAYYRLRLFLPACINSLHCTL